MTGLGPTFNLWAKIHVWLTGGILDTTDDENWVRPKITSLIYIQPSLQSVYTKSPFGAWVRNTRPQRQWSHFDVWGTEVDLFNCSAMACIALSLCLCATQLSCYGRHVFVCLVLHNWRFREHLCPTLLTKMLIICENSSSQDLQMNTIILVRHSQSGLLRKNHIFFY